MKRLSIIYILSALLLLLSSCTPDSKQIADFEVYKPSLYSVAEAAKNYVAYGISLRESTKPDGVSVKYQENEYSRVVMSFDEYSKSAQGEYLKDDFTKISELGLTYLYATEVYVIFWDSEAQEYGILYSLSPLNIIESIYSDMEYNKLSKCWYELGKDIKR